VKNEGQASVSTTTVERFSATACRVVLFGFLVARFGHHLSVELKEGGLNIKIAVPWAAGHLGQHTDNTMGCRRKLVCKNGIQRIVSGHILRE
jgi:hypothetical protein